MAEESEDQPVGGVGASPLVAALVAAAAMMIISASTAWGCVAMASLDLTPSMVQPGQDVQFGGSFYHDAAPVVLHWDSLEGPVLASVGPESLIDFRHGHWRNIEGHFAVPSDATPGAHVVIATQAGSSGKPTWGVPSRAVLQVGEATSRQGARASGGPLARLSGPRFPDEGGGAAALIAGAVGLASCVLTVAVAGVLFRVRARHLRTASS